MTVVVAGMASGLAMALVFVTVWSLTLFSVAKAPSPRLATTFQKFPPGNMVLAGAVLAYPIWSIIGMVLGLFYHITNEQAPGGGLGSPNMLFTVAIIISTFVAVFPRLVFLRRFLKGLLVLTLAFAGVFGWFLPYFVNAG